MEKNGKNPKKIVDNGRHLWYYARNSGNGGAIMKAFARGGWMMMCMCCYMCMPCYASKPSLEPCE